MKQKILSNIQEIRQRAKIHLERGSVTPSYQADLPTVIRLLNEALATEIVCVLRYKHHYFCADGIHSTSIAQEFRAHAAEEQTHADQLAVRIRQLGGNPDLNPESLLARSHAEYGKGVIGSSLLEMIEDDLYAERIAIESYSEIIHYLGENDPTTRRLIEEILAKEEEHAEDMASLLQRLRPGLEPGQKVA